ncbi:MAG TPA: family 20 glycosylhydrolase [Puia sp.]|uniref:family 20 glycosylhydrolase n=1 Tax=Puia sp. TaxID=2045100 RepID=UPI002CE81E2D|nr:family 20 glycosylhydrolase [Puia sp.]HVU96745.1 family 20 glycosylhydrolase [Puia sp.]
MTKIIRLLLVLGLFMPGARTDAQPIGIIPQPVSTQWHDGSFSLNANTVIVADPAQKPTVSFFNDYLQRFYGLKLHVVASAPASNYIQFQTTTGGSSPKDHYTLKAAPTAITITGNTDPGTFYGMQTLIQLLPVSPFESTPNGPAIRPAAGGTFAVPAVAIEDEPRFAYRGLHLDVGRHFFPVDFIKRYLDYIALHKMNYFHWHLTEDQGWRVEIKKYPKLTEVGAWRSGTIIGHHPGTGDDSTRHGGYYTQDQIKEVVQYAADRYITIIPEIEMPGHATAALAAYPYLGCTGGPYTVPHNFGVHKDVFCAGNDSVFSFLQDVLDEVMPLFPSTYIHIGGDECPKDSWKACPKCQARMKALGLKNEEELQSYFIGRMEKYINSKGKQIIGWDEILEGGVAPNATVMSWRGEKGGIEAAKQHHNVIMTPGTYVYFDHAQTHNDDSLTIGGYLPLETVYKYEPIPAGLTDEEAKYIQGAQANMWSEYMANPRKVEYMLFPRLSALSEVLWSPKRTDKSYIEFQHRLADQYKRYALWKANSYQVYFQPADGAVRQKIADWQDSKFGLMMHWGTYSQWGVVESWSICPEDEGWTQRRGPYSATYNGYVKAYENLQTTFNPTHFDPAKWAEAAKEAGMKYVVFTTKHHDGFCMFDTKQTDYKITSDKTPFHTNPKSNVAKEVFDAFRKDGFMIGAYFSKPDWHTENYWWPYFPPKDRNVNYDPAKYPDRWKAFSDYTYRQIEELMTGYGKMDVLWLDGGWVRPLYTVDPAVEWQRGIRYEQDIDMPKIAAMARSHQPGLIVVDRSVQGEYENYTTPEQQVPTHPLDDPWETCMTMGNSWSYVPNDHYKSTTQLVQLLVKIVSRGGNFLLNVGPSPDGDWADTAYLRLKEMGAWLKVNGEGIYNSRTIAPWSSVSGNVYLTQSKDSARVYAFFLGAGKDVVLPAEIPIERFTAKPKSSVTILGRKEKLKWRQDGKTMVILIPPALQNKPVGEHAIAFRIG